MSYEQGVTYRARFCPRRGDDLKTPCPSTGEVIVVQAMFRFKDDEPFPDEWCMAPVAAQYPLWIPSGDLQDPEQNPEQFFFGTILR